MSRSKRLGLFRRMIDAGKRFVGMPVVHKYDFPVTKVPKRRGLRPSRIRSRLRRRHQPMPCHPGTITFHDLLVRKFGRKRADAYGRLIQEGRLELLPSAQELDDTPDWGFVKFQDPRNITEHAHNLRIAPPSKL